jgi:hypothetical protein
MKTSTIAFCDVLGFTDLVQQNPIETVKSELDWFKRSLYSSLYKCASPSDTPTFAELREHKELGVAWFSDTILLYTLKDDDKCLQALISSVAWLVFQTMFNPKVRIRCGISFGETFIDEKESIYIGKPIIEAYNLEENQDWSGGALTDTARERIPRKFHSGRYPEWPLIPYKVPLKNKTILDTLAINWTFGIHTGMKITWSDIFEEPTEQDIKIRPGVTEKFQNTKTFHNQVCRTCGSKI